MFESITEKIGNIFRNLRGLGKLTERNISDMLTEVRSALLEADVNFTVANQFIERVKSHCLGQEVLKNITPDQQIVKVIHDELVQLLGDGSAEISRKRPLKVLLLGLHGSGKTTSAAKLALFLKNKEGFQRPLTIGCDVYRPAAVEQLQILSQQVGADCYSEVGNKDAVKIAKNGLIHAKVQQNDLILIDTAGRLQVDSDLIQEIKKIAEVVQPDEVLLVADGALGQEAANIAKTFNESVPLTGIILTKLDGDTRGGAALSMKEVTGVPIKLIGTGEKLELLEIFHPTRIAQRILGMGDIITLVEKAQEQFEENKAKELEKKLRKGKFDLNDFLEQLQSIKKMGPVDSLIKHFPGMGHVEIDPSANSKVKQVEAVIYSMTLKERSNPGIIDGSRKLRIAKGCGLNVQEVNSVLKNFKQLQQVMKKLKGSKLSLGALFGR